MCDIWKSGWLSVNIFLFLFLSCGHCCPQVYTSQILVASALGAVVQAVGSVRVIPAVAAVGAFLGFLTALFLVIYPDDEASSSEQDEDSAGSPRGSDPSRDTFALLDLRDEVTLVHSVAWAASCKAVITRESAACAGKCNQMTFKSVKLHRAAAASHDITQATVCFFRTAKPREQNTCLATFNLNGITFVCGILDCNNDSAETLVFLEVVLGDERRTD